LPWTSSPPSFGFSPADAKAAPHLPPPSWWGEFSVEKEEKEKESTLNLYKAALRLRQKLQTKEELEIIDSPQGVVRYRRPGGWEVIFNLSNEQGIEIPQGGEVLIASGPLENGRVGKDTAVWVKV
jgi:alpha-glucosidase